jgi:Peptidase_C39 like family
VATDLFLAASAWSQDSLVGAVPPSCRRGIDLAPSPERDGDDLTVSLPEWRPRRPAHRLVPAFSLLGAGVSGFRFEMSVFSAGMWSPWVAGAAVGRARFPAAVTRSETLTCEVDEFLASPPAERIRLVLRSSITEPSRPFGDPWFVALSAWSPDSTAEPSPGGAARLSVPAYSQMEEASEIRSRICSPASVAMVLAYHGARVAVGDLAREVFQPELDLYGVWPAAVNAAGRRGVAGYLLRFPDWSTAAWCLEHGMPIVASVRYAAGELTGAAIEQTSGHLLVLTGYEGDHVLVNDPAAPRTGEVGRRYRLDEIRRVWLARAGVGYVLFTPGRPSRR